MYWEELDGFKKWCEIDAFKQVHNRPESIPGEVPKEPPLLGR